MKGFKEFIGQIIPVMIGVYLGFALNNFGEAQKLKSQADTFRQMLRNEILQNLEEVRDSRTYHVQLSENFSALAKSKNILQAFSDFKFKGLQPGLLNDSAYNTGIQTGIIQEFDLQLIQSINRLYKLQHKYDVFNESMISNFLSRKFPETEQEIRSLLISMDMSMNDVLSFEQELTIFYEHILEDI